MSDLSGNLEMFGLRQVLGLLADAGVKGELRVTSVDLDGRIFFEAGVVAYATTRTAEDSVLELDSLMELYETDNPDDVFSDGIDSGREPAQTLEAALQEQITEVLFHLTRLESGSFEFDHGASSSPYGSESGHTFAVGDLLGRVDARIEEWRKIGEVIPSTDIPYQLVAHLGNGTLDVTLDARTWSFLAAVAGGASVEEVAESLQVYELHAARKFVDLIRRGLLAAAADEGSTVPADSAFEPAVPRVQPATDAITFSERDLSREEINDVIRNIGKGIYPSD